MLSRITRNITETKQSNISTIALENQIKSLYDIYSLDRTSPVTQQGWVDSLGGNASPGVVDGGVNLKVKGKTVTNLVENGNFKDGTAGWIARGGIGVVASNVYSSTGDGSYLAPYDIADLKIPTTLIGKKIFYKALVRVTNSDATKLRLVISDEQTIGLTNGERAIANPARNVWYPLYQIATIQPGRTGNVHMYAQHFYGDAATANGKTMEIQDICAIDLSALGLEDKTADEINEMFPSYIDSTKSVNPVRIKTVGKNIWGGRKAAEDTVNRINNPAYASLKNIDGRNVLELVGGAPIVGKIVFDKFKPNTQYNIQFEARRTVATQNGGYFLVKYTDGSNQPLNATSDNWELRTLTTFPNKSILNVFTSYGYDVSTYYDYDTFQITEGTVATPYEEYRESLSYINPPIPLKSLPNGVKDEVDNEGKLTQKISKVYTIKEEDISNLSVWSEVSIVGIPKEVFENSADFIEDYPLNIQVFGKERTRDLAREWETLENIGKYFTSPTLNEIVTGKLQFVVDKDISLEEAKTLLAGTKLIYQLAVPVQHELQVAPLQSFESGTLIQEHVIGEVGFYSSKCSVIDSNYPIEFIDKLYKVNAVNGSKTSLDITKAEIASDGYSFTHSDLVNGDLVDWDYVYPSELSTIPELEYTVPLASVKDMARALGTEGEVF